MRQAWVAAALVVASSIAIQPLIAQRSSSAKNDPNRLICRSTLKTGTLAGRERTCLTRAQWDEQAARQSKVGFDMQEKYRTSCGTNGGQC
jgi:hypothetical protein